MHVKKWGELSVCCGHTAPLGVAESWGAEKSLSVLCPLLPWPRDAAYLQDPARGSEAVAVCSSLSHRHAASRAEDQSGELIQLQNLSKAGEFFNLF